MEIMNHAASAELIREVAPGKSSRCARDLKHCQGRRGFDQRKATLPMQVQRQ